MARYRRERTPKERERSAQVWPVRIPLASTFLPPLTCSLRRGDATLLFKTAPRPPVLGLPPPLARPRFPTRLSPAPVPPAVLKRFDRSRTRRSQRLGRLGSRRWHAGCPVPAGPVPLLIKPPQRAEELGADGIHLGLLDPVFQLSEIPATHTRTPLIRGLRQPLQPRLQFRVLPCFLIKPPPELAKRQPRRKPLILGEINDLLPSVQSPLLRQRTQHLLHQIDHRLHVSQRRVCPVLRQAVIL